MNSTTETFNDVTVLRCTGGGNISVQADGTIKGAERCDQSGETLTIEGERRDSSISISGGNITISGASAGGMTITSGGNTSAGRRANTVRINGVLVDLNRLQDNAVEETASPPPTYKLDTSCKIRSLMVKGSADLTALPEQFVSKNAFNVNITGSGTAEMTPGSYQAVTINVQGSGDANCSGALTSVATINVMGSGDVRGLHVTESGSVSVMGSGDVRISADSRTNISKTTMGSGSIRVT